MLRGNGQCVDDRNLQNYGLINLNVQLLQGMSQNIPKLSAFLKSLIISELEKSDT